MNPIDQMLLNHANKIGIQMFSNLLGFEVTFSNLPSPEALAPLLSLIETNRFSWSELTKYNLKSQKMHDLYSFSVEAVNVIPASEAISALAQMWRDDGYTVIIAGNHANLARNTATSEEEAKKP